MSERKPLSERFWAKVEKTDGCWLWTGSVTRDGYGQICKGGKQGKMLRAHAVAWFLEHGKWAEYLCHTCDVPRCIRIGHLFEGDPKINAADRHAKGRTTGATVLGIHPKGEQVNHAKLTTDQVRHIRKLYDAGGGSIKELMGLFTLSKTAITCVVKRKTWKHVE